MKSRALNFSIMLVATLLSISSKASAADLFVLVDEPTNRSADQNRQLENIRNLPTTDEANIIAVDPKVLTTGDEVTLPLSRSSRVAVNREALEVNDDGTFTWDGQVADQLRGDATIVVNGNAVTATFQTEGGLYRIRPIGEGLHVLVKVKDENFPPEHPPNTNEGGDEGLDLPEFQRKSEADRSMTEIKVLIAYTPAVESVVADVKGLADLAISETNKSYRNSDIRIKLKAATSRPFEVSYVESGSFQTDLNALQNKADGKMDNIHSLREQSKADVVILIINQDQFCGLASKILATASTAFAVVYQDCATGYYSFGHELGHLQGARHNPEADSHTSPFVYGHGYMNEARRRRTIMSYDCPNHCKRAQRWAVPPEWGTPNISNDARVLNETANHIASFR